VKKTADGSTPKAPWSPSSDAHAAPAGEPAWKGKPKGGDRPWAAKDARGKPTAKPAGEKKPFKTKKKPNG